MAKDQKGHGSNKRGGGMVKVSVTRPIGYTVHGIGSGGKKTLLKSGGPSVEEAARTSYSPNKSGATNGPLVSNAAAAAALSSGGPKSDAAPVHEAMRYAPNHPDSNAHQHDYHPESVNKAIANSGRFGGGKIGKREGSMIHAILKGRGR